MKKEGRKGEKEGGRKEKINDKWVEEPPFQQRLPIWILWVGLLPGADSKSGLLMLDPRDTPY